ncbi:protein kinase [Perkinsela sp. CCAP 1560/4]|nr:protein kinase [Perkinsela sp. CCAP 1560/4]|eukprot:KNH07442.1 protein kinase [Perkinsela sp. CCAP 1560/4]
MCFQVLRPPTKHEIERQLLKEKTLREKLQALITKRESIAEKALDDRKDTVHVLESMKDRYVILLRQRKMISRAIHRRADEMRSLKKVISKNRLALQR